MSREGRGGRTRVIVDPVERGPVGIRGGGTTVSCSPIVMVGIVSTVLDVDGIMGPVRERSEGRGPGRRTWEGEWSMEFT